MKFLFFTCILTLPALSQESQLRSEIPSDWQAPAVQEKELLPLSVKSRQCYHKDGRTVTVEECEAPASEPSITDQSVVRDAPLLVGELEQIENYVPPVAVWLTATIYKTDTGKVLTKLSAQVGEDKCVVWSNLNYDYIQGAHRFAVNDIEYELDALGLSLYTEQEANAPMRNRALYSDVVTFVPAHRVAQDNAAYTAIVDLHTMYRENTERLKLVHEKRMENKARHDAWKEANPPKPKDVTIRFWKRDLSKEEK